MKINDICLSPTTIMSAHEKAKKKDSMAVVGWTPAWGRQWEKLERQQRKFLSWLEAWVLNELVLEMSDDSSQV